MTDLDPEAAPARARPKRLTLIDEWKREARRLWSMRAALGGALLWSAVGGLLMVWPGIASVVPPLAYAVIGVALSIIYGLARILKQPGTDT
ncbi:hypothetical protein RPPS3_25860 [Rhodopseudomonas palustris]|uniref:DUF7940 domain-containing protein n=1 Tax=Rhodopseudomonas palustris TaxID=1076 RepID=UPI000D1BEB55|nr:hypothetical protein [Rhodopseudomonas palustris]AVT76649.1 hypothetical protein RPPS3_25860 [Rhodopseudomonas palustris]